MKKKVDGSEGNRKRVRGIENPEKRLMEKGMSTWIYLFMFPMM